MAESKPRAKPKVCELCEQPVRGAADLVHGGCHDVAVRDLQVDIARLENAIAVDRVINDLRAQWLPNHTTI